jgi:hypothetical protein
MTGIASNKLGLQAKVYPILEFGVTGWEII